ncbi:c-type cytochrome [Myroides sp. DF42-4-2]|uniref:c-type cytochrome n=1 Tax=unclassified Myroides TaxID=2642485 RepID=UPI002574D1BD|nr:c-type cytochrome [Myroides sp. DF42-4-2]MDM1407883.1 c-type cytochrome [Myroides sp. DF42-4-2]
MRNTLIKTIPFLVALLVFSCGKKEEKQAMPEAVYESERGGATEMTQAEKIALGKKIFEGKGTCASCHLADKKVIGPSIREIVQIYDKHDVSLISFLKGQEEAIVDPAQFIIMQANLEITKKMSDTELEALEAYMRSM